MVIFVAPENQLNTYQSILSSFQTVLHIMLRWHYPRRLLRTDLPNLPCQPTFERNLKINMSESSYPEYDGHNVMPQEM